MKAHHVMDTYLHVQDGGKTEVVPVSASFWQDVMAGRCPALDQGRLMSAFSFAQAWPTWERHPEGEELVMLLSGEATLALEVAGQEQVVSLAVAGAYVLVPQGVWHTARTNVPTTMLFLTPGSGTEHRPV